MYIFAFLHCWCTLNYSFDANNDPSGMWLIVPNYVSALVGSVASNKKYVDIIQKEHSSLKLCIHAWLLRLV